MANDDTYEDFLRHWETIPLEQCPCRHFTVAEIQTDFRIDLSSWAATDYLKAKVLANSFTAPTFQVSVGGPGGELALFLQGADAGATDHPLHPLDIKQAFDQMLEVVRLQCQNYKKKHMMIAEPWTPLVAQILQAIQQTQSYDMDHTVRLVPVQEEGTALPTPDDIVRYLNTQAWNRCDTTEHAYDLLPRLVCAILPGSPDVGTVVQLSRAVAMQSADGRNAIWRKPRTYATKGCLLAVMIWAVCQQMGADISVFMGSYVPQQRQVSWSRIHDAGNILLFIKIHRTGQFAHYTMITSQDQGPDPLPDITTYPAYCNQLWAPDGPSMWHDQRLNRHGWYFPSMSNMSTSAAMLTGLMRKGAALHGPGKSADTPAQRTAMALQQHAGLIEIHDIAKVWAITRKIIGSESPTATTAAMLNITTLLAVSGEQVVKMQWQHPLTGVDPDYNSETTALFNFYDGHFGPGYHIPAHAIHLPTPTHTVTIQSNGQMINSSETIATRSPDNNGGITQVGE